MPQCDTCNLLLIGGYNCWYLRSITKTTKHVKGFRKEKARRSSRNKLTNETRMHNIDKTYHQFTLVKHMYI